MRKAFLLILIILLIHKSNAQEQLKSGIYKDANEFKFNKPSIPFNFSMDSSYNHIIKDYFFILKLTKEQENNLGYYFGFSDGNFSYINPFGRNTYALSPSYFYRHTVYYRVKKPLLYTAFKIVGAGYNRQVPYLVILELNSGNIIYHNIDKIKDYFSIDIPFLDEYNSKVNQNNYDGIFKHQSVESINFFINSLKEFSIKHEEQINDVKIYIGEIGLNQLLFEYDSTKNIDDYYNNVFKYFSINESVKKVKIEKKYYKNGNLKSSGIKTDNTYNSDSYPTENGIWFYYDKNGKKVKEILFDIENKVISKKKFK